MTDSTAGAAHVPGSVLPYTRRGFYEKEKIAIDLGMALLPHLGKPRILDIGCATGRTSREFVDLFQAELIGIDLDKSAIEEAKVRVPEAEFKVMDACNLAEFESETFDFVLFSFNGIDYISEPSLRAKCLTEIARVLRPGGIFVYSSHNLFGLASNRDSRRLAFRNLFNLILGGRYLCESSAHWNVKLYHGTLQSERLSLARAAFKLIRVIGAKDQFCSGDASWRCRDHWPYYVAKKLCHEFI